jgi:hypothetical protein
MGTVFAGNKLVSPKDDTSMRLAAIESVAISVGDMLWWDSTAKRLKPMDQFSATGTAATDRATLGAAFAGIALQGKLAADPSTGYPARGGECITAAQDGLYEADCDAATFEPDDQVSVVIAAGTGLGKVENLKVAKTVVAGESIGYVVDRYATNTTKVLIRFVGKFSPFRFADKN